ncbi:membrane protein GlpM [Formosimonas limnophila]|uniref:Membrane protein GlpM n=1 Tax=Formosimonas limnophila TaxID=1384487 RepID=A0A8J3CIT3_9BURK|nr:GlpM family protein [Formosimonas limnophila]GHA77222.1 membrane protein GlpM [Formosimonas limnophila]
MSLLLKAFLGAAAVVAIALLSRSRYFLIAGLVPLFPSFALISHYIVGVERSRDDLKATIIFGLWALLPYAVYLIAAYFLVDKMALTPALVLSATFWCLAAGMLVYFRA